MRERRRHGSLRWLGAMAAGGRRGRRGRHVEWRGGRMAAGGRHGRLVKWRTGGGGQRCRRLGERRVKRTTTWAAGGQRERRPAAGGAVQRRTLARENDGGTGGWRSGASPRTVVVLRSRRTPFQTLGIQGPHWCRDGLEIDHCSRRWFRLATARPLYSCLLDFTLRSDVPIFFPFMQPDLAGLFKRECFQARLVHVRTVHNGCNNLLVHLLLFSSFPFHNNLVDSR
jgi:hypothetical protein